jgi:hypothetical protein
MKLEKFEKLKVKLEILKLEKNFFALNKVLYYFSFLGNIFLIYFGYFFIKSITDTLPDLFPYQNTFLTVFIALFLTGYELTKRFVIEQFSISVLQLKKINTGLVIGFIVSLLLISGSFYLSINGAHRLVDSTEEIVSTLDSSIANKQDSISKYYDKEILYYRSQPAKTREDRRYRDSTVASLESIKETKLNKIEVKTETGSKLTIDKNKENDVAFIFMTIFLEFIIVLGVAFNSFYLIGTYQETKTLLATPKYKQIQLNLQLLKLYFQAGKKNPGDLTLSASKFMSIVKNQKINCTQSEARSFITLCLELDIIKDTKNRRKEYQVTYEEAKKLILKEELL